MNQYFRRKFSLTFPSVVKEFSNFEILNYSILRNILFPYEGNFKLLVATTMPEEDTQPLLKVCTYPEPRSGEAKIKIRLPWDKILSVCYSLLLCWQVIGNCLYFIRCVKCFRDKTSTFLCERNAAFLYSEELEVVWLTTQTILIVVVIVLLPRIPGFLGLKAIFHRLICVPSFFTLVLLLVIAVSRDVMLLLTSPKTFLTMAILIGFALKYTLAVLAAAMLNYTQLSTLKHRYPLYVFLLSKLTVFVIFLASFIHFTIALIAITFNVQKFPAAMSSANSTDFHVVNKLLENFGVTSFRFKLMSFFWTKLFIDDKGIF